MRALMRWLDNHLNLITAVVLVGVLLLMILQMSNVSEQAKVNAKLLQNQATLLHHINADGDARSKAVDDLKKDNAAQTIILCKLILSSNLNFKDNDAAEIETICKQKIRDAAPVATATSPTPETITPAPAAAPQQTMAPTSTPTPVTPPTPTPPQSIIPLIKDPLIGCVTKGICI